MARTGTPRIRPGAAVVCTDGRVGTVKGIEPAPDRPRWLRVLRGWEDEEIQIPINLVSDVDGDGTVHLICDQDGLEVALEREDAVPAANRELGPDERTIELREEQLVAHKELRELGEVEIRTEVEDVPGRLEVEAYREEVEIEHVPVNRIVSERVDPWEENGVLIVPVYEEQLVVTKRLVLREHLRVRRFSTVEHQLFEDTLRRDRVVVEDPNDTGLVHERYPADDQDNPTSPESHKEGRRGFLRLNRD
jgi:uncharacterized protein (TIGR02271 family)